MKELLTALVGTSAPTLFVIGGFVFLFLALATIKSPIIIDLKPPSNRKIAFILGIIFTGVGIYLLTLPSTAEETNASGTEIPTTIIMEAPAIANETPQIILKATELPSQLPTSTIYFEDCLSADIWTTTSPNSRTTKDNCVDVSANGFSTLDNNLLINIQNGSPKTSMLYMPAPETGIIKMNVKIDTFQLGENGNLAIGLSNSTCKITEGEFIFYRSSDSKIFTIYGTTALDYGNTLSRYTLGSIDTVEFHVNKSAFEIYVNNVKAGSGYMTTNTPTFCVGYRFPYAFNLVSVISNFSIEN